MPTEASSAHPSARRWLDYRRKRFWAVVLVLIYVLGGFFAAPPILRGQLVSSLQKALDRPVALDGVSVNPLILSVDLRGLRVAEKDGSPLLGFDRLHIRLSPASLVQWAWSFGEIRLEGFKGTIVRYGTVDTNIGRLTDASAGDAKPAAEQGGVPRLIIRHLGIVNATVDYTDHVPAPAFTTRIGPVNAEIDSFSTLPDKTGRQHVLIDLEHGATLEWTADSSLRPLASQGHVAVKGPYAPLVSRYLGDALKLSMPSGTLAAELDYRVQQRPDGSPGVAVDHLGLVVKDLAVTEPGAPAPFLTLAEFRLAGGHLAWPEREAGADSLMVDGLGLSLVRQQDGAVALPLPQAGSRQSPPEAKAEWGASLGKLEVRNAKAQFEDRALHAPGKIEIASLGVTADSLSNKAGAAFPFAVAVGLAPGGTAKLEGKASVAPGVAINAKLSIADLPIAIAQPYLHDLAKLTIEDGRVEAVGDVTLQDPDGLKVAGHGEIRSLKLKDEVEKTPVVAWERLSIDRYVYRQSANDLEISQATLNGPYLRFQVAADQSTNFSHILLPAAPAKPAAPAATAEPMKIGVGRIAVAAGSADYGDASLPLPFATHVTNLQGHVASLVSTAASASAVSLQGQVDQYGSVTVYGRVNPFQPAKGMNINVVFRNVDFPGLSPYSVKFAGRRIAQGKLDVTSKYSVDSGKLNGANRVVIRDMELGEKVDVPGALDLPLDLAISLLKDSEGKIDLDLPVTGNVNDPQFDFGGVIAKAIADMLGDLVTAPFRALASLFGGQADSVQKIDFAPGRAVLDPPEQEKIRQIADILQKRPKLGVVVAGVVDQDADRRRLQRDALDAEMAKQLGDHDMVDRQRRYLESLFEKRIGKDQLAAVRQPFAASLDDPAYIAALRRQVATTEPIDDGALAALAKARGDAVAAALKQVPGLDPQRVTIQDAKAVKADDESRIPLTLEAAAR